MKFETFSKKQLTALTWWCKDSDYEKCDAIICDGAVRSGKTMCMSISYIGWAFYKFNDSSFAICGKTIRSLRRNVVTPLLPVLKELGFTCVERLSQNIIEISRGDNTNRFYLFGGKDEASASLIQGMTLSGVFFDEVALMPRSFVEQALARCSVNGSTFWFNCNPEYPGHWFRQEWILNREKKNALYLHFKMEDNPSLSKTMLNRYKSLYSGTFYKRFIEGMWVSAQGAVYPFMGENTAFCEVPCEAFTRYAVSCDYGTVNPASFGLWGEQGGVWYRIDEYYYNSRIQGVQRTDEEHYTALEGLIGDKRVEAVVVDPSAASFIEVIKRHGRYKVTRADNKVLDGIRKVSTALKDSKIKICKNCKASIEEFGLYRWQEGGSDAPVKENDHAMDDIRYFVTAFIDDDNDGFFAFAARR